MWEWEDRGQVHSGQCLPVRVEASGVEVLHRVDGTHHDTVGLADSGQLLGEIEIECELRHGSDDYRDLTQDVSIAHRKHSSTKFKYN